ncbi:MAG: MarR family winged helix-turn-helix transcriptional regulator [Clostridia bacterium]|nr:MarR family winged helix-turn-helix transcriptional regulator [Clostridia bacterium]
MEDRFYTEFGNNIDLLQLLFRLKLLSPIQEIAEKCGNSFVERGKLERQIISTLYILKGCTMNELGRRTSASYPHLCKVLDRMESENYIYRLRNTTDKKGIKICLSEEGYKIVEEYENLAQSISRVYLNGIYSEEEQREMNDLAIRFIEILNSKSKAG